MYPNQIALGGIKQMQHSNFLMVSVSSYEGTNCYLILHLLKIPYIISNIYSQVFLFSH